MPADFLSLLSERVLILDGAMGTNIHRFNPTDADWGGSGQVNNCDYVGLTHPEWIYQIHKGFLEVGCDAVETNTFNSSKLVLAEFKVADQLDQMVRRNVQVARDAVKEFSTPSRPRFVIGSIGPGTKMASVENESIYAHFDTIAGSYRPQLVALVEEGVDALLIETCFDVLQAKCVAIAAIEVMKQKGVRLPLMVQITPDDRTKGEKLLPGTEIASAVTTLLALPEIDVLGLNCSVGPDWMAPAVKTLYESSDRFISVVPNAGIPIPKDGATYFPLQPNELADWLEKFVSEYGVNIVGGCCGTTVAHLKAVIDRVGGRKPAARSLKVVPAVSSLFASMDLHQDPRPLIIGERTNTNGSRKFKQLLEKEDWHGLVEMGKEQEREGAHVIDVCTAYVGRDEVRDMKEVIRRFNAVITRPIMIDSTEVPVIEESLKLVSGKPIINSVNLEDGREKFDKIVGLARKFGAALVCGCIDERGMARTSHTKFEVAARIYDICTKEYGLPPSDLLFDPLVLPVSTGQEEERRNGLETIEGIRRIKQGLPGALTTVGLSNVSFGLSPYARQVVNSVFLHYGIEYGLDSAILHAAKIIPLASIDDTGRELARRLIFAEYDQGDPLQMLIEHYADRKAESKKGASLGDSVEERLRQAIIQGRRETLIADLDAARERYTPLDIINKILLDGMKVVGDLFGSGQMQLPFVLQSAEVMKAAVAYLQQFMEKVTGSEKGKIVLATVKGDVHDIGKNLVDIILSNNGYKVFNLGIKQPIDAMIQAYHEHNADAIGMSGLLVKSTVVMKEDLLTLNDRRLDPPVILGGAALTRRYVEQDLTALYKGPLFYGEDAFGGLHIMDRLMTQKRLRASGSRGVAGLAERPRSRPEPEVRNGKPTDAAASCCPTHVRPALPARSPTLKPAPDVPAAPFWGSKVVTDIRAEDVFPYLNERTLFSTQWQFRRTNVRPAEYERQMREVAYPTLERLKQFCLAENILRPAVAYGFFPCASEGNDLVVYEDDGRTERVRFTFPRQDFGDFLCLSDYSRPGDGRATDVVAFTAVTMGDEVSRRAKEFFEADRYTDYLYLHGLGVEAAEALAELFHKRVREEWGIATDDSRDIRKLFKKHYRGCRYSFGYPACPNLEDQVKLFELLRPERIGLKLSEQFQLEPEQSTTALVVHHPQAKYFNVTRSAGCGPASENDLAANDTK
jgi:5-methyltetrahydrofolate--homocysteine methyltransferase